MQDEQARRIARRWIIVSLIIGAILIYLIDVVFADSLLVKWILLGVMLFGGIFVLIASFFRQRR